LANFRVVVRISPKAELQGDHDDATARRKELKAAAHSRFMTSFPTSSLRFGSHLDFVCLAEYNFVLAGSESKSVQAKVLHLLSGLEVGGKERVTVRLASRGAKEGMNHHVLLYDTEFRSEKYDFSPGPVPISFIQRMPGIDLGFAWKVAKRAAELEVNVIHAHNDTAIFYAALATLLSTKRNLTFIGTFHARPSHATAGARVLTRWASSRACKIIAVSQELNDWLLQSGWVGQCTTIHNGVDLVEFDPYGRSTKWRERMEIPDDAILVGHVARFDPIKRHSDILEAASLLQRASPPIFFALAGHGPLFDDILARAATLTNVRVLGNITNIATFLRCLDIFVLCSDHEAAPLTLLEAMACGRAVIATGVGGVPELLNAGGTIPTACMIPTRRPDLLTKTILMVANDPELRTTLGKEARARAEAS
jgi:L-malate glycosyltransferase